MNSNYRARVLADQGLREARHRLVALVMCEFVDERGVVRASIGTLARLTCMAEPELEDVLEELATYGRLQRTGEGYALTPPGSEPPPAYNYTAPYYRPTLDEVEAYAATIDEPMRASAFFDHYEANGWRMGKQRIYSWRAAYRKWCRSAQEMGITAPRPKGKWVSPEEYKPRR